MRKFIIFGAQRVTKATISTEPKQGEYTFIEGRQETFYTRRHKTHMKKATRHISKADEYLNKLVALRKKVQDRQLEFVIESLRFARDTGASEAVINELVKKAEEQLELRIDMQIEQHKPRLVTNAMKTSATAATKASKAKTDEKAEKVGVTPKPKAKAKARPKRAKQPVHAGAAA